VEGELAELVVDERQQLLGGVRVALLDGAQNARDLAHVPNDKPKMANWQAAVV
jgi:hypothetical protein